MKNCNHIMGQVRATVMSLVAVVALFAAARMEASTGGNDTLMVYNSWEAIFDLIPDTIVANPEIKVRSEYDFEFKATSRDAKAVNKMLKNEAVAVCLGDTLWLINSD